jgi:hypothetical protein
MFIIERFDQLNALVRALHAAKFTVPAEKNPIFAGSPILADVMDEAYDALLAAAVTEVEKNIARSFRTGRALKKRDDVQRVVLEHLRLTCQDRIWGQWTKQDRFDFVRILIRPYCADDELVEDLLQRPEQSP